MTVLTLDYIWDDYFVNQVVDQEASILIINGPFHSFFKQNIHKFQHLLFENLLIINGTFLVNSFIN